MRLIAHLSFFNEKRNFGILLAVLFIAFSLTYVPAVISPQFGWWQYFAWRMECGDVLYRDIYLFLPPYFVFLTDLLYKFLGNHLLLYTLLVGLPVKLLCLLLVYDMVCRLAKPLFAMVAVLFAGCISATYFTDMLYDFNPVTMLPCLLLSYSFLKMYERLVAGRGARMTALLTGLLLAVVFCLKQTFGITYAFTIGVMTGVFVIKERLLTLRQAIGLAGWALTGAIIGMLPVLVYITYYHLWHDFFYCIFSIADAKGGMNHIFLRFILPLDNLKAWVYIGVITLLWLLQKRYFPIAGRDKGTSASYFNVWVLSGIAIMVLVAAIYVSQPETFHRTIAKSGPIHKYFDRFYYMLTYGGLIAWITLLVRYFSGRVVDKSLLLFTSLIVTHFFTGLVSTDSLEPIYLSIYTPWMLAYAFNARCRLSVVKNTVLIALVFSWILVCISAKRDCPYSWQGWREPAITSRNVCCTVPGLENISVPPEVNKTFDQFVSLIKENTTENDQVLQFANIPLFNLLTERVTPGYAPITWFDVCPDDIAVGVARECFLHPPKMVVWHQMDQKNWYSVEKVFRNGNPSGQRELQRFYNEVVRRDYRLLLRTYNHRDGMLELWLRK